MPTLELEHEGPAQMLQNFVASVGLAVENVGGDSRIRIFDEGIRVVESPTKDRVGARTSVFGKSFCSASQVPNSVAIDCRNITSLVRDRFCKRVVVADPSVQRVVITDL